MVFLIGHFLEPITNLLLLFVDRLLKLLYFLQLVHVHRLVRRLNQRVNFLVGQVLTRERLVEVDRESGRVRLNLRELNGQADTQLVDGAAYDRREIVRILVL